MNNTYEMYAPKMYAPKMDEAELYDPSYWGEINITHYITDKPLTVIQKELIDAFNKKNVGFIPSSDHKFGYDCEIIFNCKYFKFNIFIWNDNTNHIVEFQHMYGCGFAYNTFIDEFAKEFNIIFKRKAIQLSPYIPHDTEPLTKISASILFEQCNFVLNMISEGSGDFIQGLHEAGYLAQNKYKNELFSPGGNGLEISYRVIDLFNISDCIEMQATSLAVIGNIADIPDVCPILLNIIANLIFEIKNTNILIHYQVLQIAMAISHSKHFEHMRSYNNILQLLECKLK